MASRWDNQVRCTTRAEATVEKDKFQRNGMIARICRREATYMNGIAYGGIYLVKARIPKKGVNQFVINKHSQKTPFMLVNVPTLEETKIEKRKLGNDGKPMRDFRNQFIYEEEVVVEKIIKPTAMRIEKSDIKAFVKKIDDVIEAKLNPKKDEQS